MPRAYCTVAETSVQPMRADVCNARYGLEPAERCEIVRAHAEEGDGDGGESGDGSD